MRSQRKKQIMTLSILVVAILVISVGFAAFSSTLKINSAVNVNPDSSTFGVKFSSSSTALETNDIEAVATGSASGGDAVIVNGVNPTITNLSANFTKPGETVTYNFYVRNVGKYLAHLTSIVFDNAIGVSSNKECTAKLGTSNELVQAACNGISVKVEVDGITATETDLGITGSTLDINESKEVKVTISYDSNASRADGPFDIEFGNIYLTYGTVETGEMPTLPTLVYDTWDGVSATSLDELDKNDTLKTVNVNSAADLAGVRDAVNSGQLIGYTITLNTSIDLAENVWEPIGKAKTYIQYTEGDSYFTGKLNGNGYTIKGLNVVGDFSSTGAGFFGTVSGDVAIENLILRGAVKVNGKPAGGLIGYAKDYNGATNLTVKNTIIDVSVTAQDIVGGMLGLAKTTGTVTIEGVKNIGAITSTISPGENAGRVGGLIAASGSNTMISDSQNEGTLTGGAFLAGAIGYIVDGTNIITRFTNNGTLLSDGNVGGVVGYVAESGTLTIADSINNANITSTGKYQGHAGGMVGTISRPLTITNSTNNGNITTTYLNAGGIVGLIQTDFRIENCVNNGTVHSLLRAGGIIGYATINGLHDVKNEYNLYITNNNGGTGAITIDSDDGNVGRIIGRFENGYTTLLVVEGNTGTTDIPLFGSGNISQ